MPASLQLLADDRLVGSQDVQLESGANRFVLPVDSLPIGTHVLRLLMQADADPRPQNKTGGAYVIVDGPPRVLIVEGSAGQGQYLASALQASGLQVDTTRAQDGPFQADTLNNYASVILANVPADQMTPAGVEALQNYVQTHGGGLVVSGGAQAYGPGGYARSPLESLLPVKADLRGTSLQSSVGLVLAIDTSGSMGDNIGGTTIMELAKEAAIAAAESLGPTDKIGVISFEDKSSWAIQPTDVSQMDSINAAVNQMTPGGGDDTISGVLDLAYDGLSSVPGQNKHVIVITDGETPGGDYANIIQKLRASSISVSTIGIGSQSDTQLLQQVAQIGGGAYYDASDPFNLPQLVLKETQQLQRAAIVEKQTQPIAVGSSPLLSGIDLQQLPALRGYVATTPKPQSSVVLAAPTADPLLVEWQLGLGRVVAWTSDASNRWSAGWLDEGPPVFQKLWTQIVKRTIRPPEDPNRQVSVSVSGDKATVALDALAGAEGSPQREYVNFLTTVASVTDPSGVTQQITLPQVGPGQYKAAVEAASDGVYTLQVTESGSDGSQSTQSSGFVVPYSPEYRDLNPNDSLMSTLVSLTGGRSISGGDEAFGHDLPAVGAPRSIWPQLLGVLMLVLVADIAVRRLKLNGVELQSGYRSVRRRLGYIDERPARPARIASTFRTAPLVTNKPPGPAHGTRLLAPGASMSQQLLAAKRRAAKR